MGDHFSADNEQMMGDSPTTNRAESGQPSPRPDSRLECGSQPPDPRRDKNVPLPEMMDQKIVSAFNRALLHQQALAHIRIMKARRNSKSLITEDTHQNATPEMAP